MISIGQSAKNYESVTKDVQFEVRIKSQTSNNSPKKQERPPSKRSVSSQYNEQLSKSEQKSSVPTEPSVKSIQATHYFSASELNRRPVIIGNIPSFKNEFSPATLGVSGEATVKVFLSASGKIDLIIFEENTIPVSITAEARDALSKTKYLPGYLSGNPVPSIVRWKLTLTPGNRVILPKITEEEAKNQVKPNPN